MKSIRYFILFSLLFLCLSDIVLSQIDWTKYESNPVLIAGPDNFDIIALGQPTVLYDEGIIKMWYPGVGDDGKARICYATSIDGISWTKHITPVLDVGGAGEWDRGWMDTPEVVKVAGVYYMMYYGDTMQLPAEISSSMGMAYSDDGLTWTKSPLNPVFTKANIGDWDGTWVESPALIYDEIEEEFLMYYNGVDTATWKLQIGLATSDDCENWLRHAANPLITNGAWGQYDDMWCGTPGAIYLNGLYEMWYSGAAAADYSEVLEGFENVSICYATSEDGLVWTKHANNPLFDTYTEPYDEIMDEGGPWAADVIFNTAYDEYQMWFETAGGIMFATAPVDLSLVKNNEPENTISVFPNPASENLNISFPEHNSVFDFVLFDTQGRIVISLKSCRAQAISLKSICKGLYSYKITSRNQVYSGRIMKN